MRSIPRCYAVWPRRLVCASPVSARQRWHLRRSSTLPSSACSMKPQTRAPSPPRDSASMAGRDQAMIERLREDLCDLPLLEVAEKIRTRQVSPVEVTERVLARIDALDHTLNAFVTVLSEKA